jgi:nucleotide-binding universal stress UspA family protein
MEVMTMAKRILTPIGEGERSEAIVPAVAALAQGTGSSVRLVRVFPVPREVVDSEGRVVAYGHQQMERLTSEGLNDLARVEAQLDGIPVEAVVRFGEPVEEILLEAEAFGADLIALAAHPRGRLRAALAPGLAERLEGKATVPILTLREPSN